MAIRTARVGGRGRDASDADAAVIRIQEEYDLTGLDSRRCLRHAGADACPRQGDSNQQSERWS